MVFITYKKITDDKARVELQHFFPELLTEDELKKGELVESIPEPEHIKGKIPVLFFNPVEKTFFYEYEDAPIPEPLQIELLQRQVDELTIVLGDLILGGV